MPFSSIFNKTSNPSSGVGRLSDTWRVDGAYCALHTDCMAILEKAENILCFYDFKRDRKRDFKRIQVRLEGATYIFEELVCHTFGDETPCHELDRQEFDTEQKARSAYEAYLYIHTK